MVYPQGAEIRNGNYRLAFVVGAPRSGTTWVQLLLSQHPLVASCQETNLFSHYLGPLGKAWVSEVSSRRTRETGLRFLLSEEEFLMLCRRFAEEVLGRADRRVPGAEVVVEKTPAHVFAAPFIAELFPDAYFLHIVRDPRSVVSSLLHAGRGWGERWAPTGPAYAARVWRSHVEAGLRIPGFSERYCEVRYENLGEDGPDQLDKMMEFLGLECDPDWSRRAIDLCNFDRLRQGESEAFVPWREPEPHGFYRRGSPDAWRDELSGRHIAIVERIASDLMARLGYHRTTDGSRPPVSLRALNALEDLGELVQRVIRRAATKF